jgi:hypothetical protein
MRTETVEYKVYKFNELSEGVQEKVLDKFRYSQLEGFDWWDSCYEWFQEQLAEVGLACKTFYFSLDRDRHIEAVDLHFTDVSKFVESVQAGVKKSILGAADLTIHATRHYRYTHYKIDTYNGMPDRCQRLNKFLDSLIDRCNDKLGEILHNFLTQLEKEEEYLTSDECIKEHIEINDYEFLENGEFF